MILNEIVIIVDDIVTNLKDGSERKSVDGKYSFWGNGTVSNLTLEEVKSCLCLSLDISLLGVKSKPKGYESRLVTSFSKSLHRYTVNGVVYASLYEAMMSTGLSKQTILYRCKKKRVGYIRVAY